MASREDKAAWTVLLWVTVGLGVSGWLVASWLAGEPALRGRPLAGALAFAGIAGVAALILARARRARAARRRERLRALVPGAPEDQLDDAVPVMERLVLERNRSTQELRLLQEEANWLERALTARMQGLDDPEWPPPGRLEGLVREIRTLLDDRDEDAVAAAELLGLWIERIELARVRIGDALASAAPGNAAEPVSGGKGTEAGGGTPRPPDWKHQAALLSRHLEATARELERLEQSARTLRRRLGGDLSRELSEDDIVS